MVECTAAVYRTLVWSDASNASEVSRNAMRIGAIGRKLATWAPESVPIEAGPLSAM